MTRAPDVLVVGAGTTGLALALQAHDHGAKVRVIDRRSGDRRPSRALIMHPRTLEVLRPLGVTDELLARGDATPTAHLHLARGVVTTRLDELDLDDTSFPHLLLIRQADVETVLASALAERDVEVEWQTELVGIEQHADHVATRIVTRLGATRSVCSRFVVGCDGKDSTVRAALGLGWDGGRHRQEVVLADLDLVGDLEPGGVHVAPVSSGLVFLFALGERAPWRLLATRPVAGPATPHGQSDAPVPEEDLRSLLDGAGFGVEVRAVGWSARVPLQHRVARSFRAGSVFIAGDAAHTHSPAGGQGMNTGIGDATNLGWKLAFAAQENSCGSSAEVLLDSYDAERRPVAERVVRLTRVIFWSEAATDPIARSARALVRWFGPPVLPHLLRRRRLVAEGVRTLSQLRIHHRRSPASSSDGSAARGLPRPGDRLADGPVHVDGRRTRMHDVTAHPGLTVMLHCDAPDITSEIAGHLVHVVRLPNIAGAGVTIVRPDGHVGYVGGVIGARNWLRSTCAPLSS